MADKLLTSEQVAQILQVHPFTVLKYIKAGKLKGFKLGRVWRIRESDMEEFLEERFMASPLDTDPETHSQEVKEIKEVKQNDEDIEIESTLSEEGKDHYILE